MILCKVYYNGTEHRTYLIDAQTVQEAEKITDRFNDNQPKGEWKIFFPRDKITFEVIDIVNGVMEI